MASLAPGRLAAIEGPLALAGARNETLGFAIQVDRSILSGAATLRFSSLTQTDRTDALIDAAASDIGQIVSLPVDFNRAGFIRQNDSAAATARAVPRAIVPLPTSAAGVISASTLRPDADGVARLWIDLAVPTNTPPGKYLGLIEVIAGDGRTVAARLPIDLDVYNLVLPDTRSLSVVGRVTWESLTRHFTDDFEAITPKLINRTDDRYKRPVATLDGLVTLAQRHRLTLTVDRLQPSVKWNPPSVDWTDFDSLVGPWLDGTAFPDGEPLNFWSLPDIDFLDNYPANARREYYANAAAHFDAREWLTRAPVWTEADPAERNATEARRRLLARAANVLASHPRVNVAVPLSTDQLEFGETIDAGLPMRADAERLITAAPGLIFNTPIQQSPIAGRAPSTFLRTDLAGLVPYAGTGGDERDVRIWAWLAYTRRAGVLRFDNVLPSAIRPDVAADPNELVWFYPGKWFGVDQPVPSLQLKWLRRAEQDHEYLSLARARGEGTNAQLIARLLTKPVQLQPAQRADPTYALMTGTADAQAWAEGVRLLSKLILLRDPGAQEVDAAARNAVELEVYQWAQPQEKPLVLGRSTLFTSDASGNLGLRVGVDVYNPSDTTPRGNTLRFSNVPRGWTINPTPTPIPPLATYQVQRFALGASVDANAIDRRQRGQVVVDLTNDYTNRATPTPMVVPVALTRQREGNLAINGSLEDWSDDDALSLAPLVRMIDRPMLQAHAIDDAPTPASVYSAWSETDLYVAFKLSGLADTSAPLTQNFVRYDFRRAWGEDVVQVLVQAIYADGTQGPVLHVAAKPNGGQWSERKIDLREAAGEEAWQPLESGVRYACTLDRGDWRGELAIPWRAILPPAGDGPPRLPTMLRFNFVQHQHATGTSASWAGPIDHGRDDLFTGALVLQALRVR